jgi:hypothetical protein
MMSERTPASVALADELANAAALAAGRAVLPGRAKGTPYVGESATHSDSDVNIPSIGFVAYLESLQAGRGALNVVPGSHRGAPATKAHAPAIGTQALANGGATGIPSGRRASLISVWSRWQTHTKPPSTKDAAQNRTLRVRGLPATDQSSYWKKNDAKPTSNQRVRPRQIIEEVC